MTKILVFATQTIHDIIRENEKAVVILDGTTEKKFYRSQKDFDFRYWSLDESPQIPIEVNDEESVEKIDSIKEFLDREDAEETPELLEEPEEKKEGMNEEEREEFVLDINVDSEKESE